jgi:hypothetical protein
MKNVTLETLEGLHRWFEGLCTYIDRDAWMDRMYAEGQIYACREALGNFDYMYKDFSRGLEMKEDEFFMKGYTAFHEQYRCEHVRYKV